MSGPRPWRARRAGPVVAALFAAVALASCTSAADPGPSTADTVDPVTTVTPDTTADDRVAGGEGACTEALQEGPLIDPEDSSLGDPPPGAEPLPIVALPDLETCELSSTAEWLGRPLVVNFWASWCGPCRAEMPMLDQFASANADRLDLVGVTVDFRPGDARSFLEEVPVDFDSWFDPDGQVLAREVSVRPMPTTLFVDADGVVVHRHIGEITREQLEQAVTEHLGVEPVAAAR